MRSSLAAALVAASPDALLIVDEDGNYVGANPAALALLGYSREALLRLSVADIVAPGPTWAAEEQVGHVRISACAAASGGVVIEVSDTGIGITADALLHIFEAFHQVDSSHTRRHEGSGLGLAIAWKLVRQMGGNLSVRSDPETGSTFRLHLPTRQP